MHILLILLVLVVSMSCNPVDKNEQGYRQNQEQETTPGDYTQGTDSPPKKQKLNR